MIDRDYMYLLKSSMIEGVSEGGFKLNVCTTSTAKARAYAEKVFEKSGKTLDAEIPDFDNALAKLRVACKKALDVPRIAMPVIEPTDMALFHKRLKKGSVDIFKPYARGKLFVPKNISRTDGDDWVTLGLRDGSKTDDKIAAKWTTVPANKLLPTQSQIWIEKLVGNIAKFGRPTSGSPLTRATLIVSKEGYILDGHHRYGQAMLANPSLRMKALYIPIPIKKLLKVGRTYGNAIGNMQKA